MEKIQIITEILNIVESIDEQYHSNPGNFTTEIKDTGEKAHQRAILFQKKTELSDTKSIIEWYDIELPVEFNSNARRQAIDLIGGNINQFSICELKFNNKKDTPLDAVKEILRYYRLILKNSKTLDDKNIHHRNQICNQNWKWSDIFTKENLIIVAANKKYWDYWRIRKKFDFKLQLSTIKNWSLKLGVEIRLYQTSDEDFRKQRDENGGDTYSPKLINGNEWIRINL